MQLRPYSRHRHGPRTVAGVAAMCVLMVSVVALCMFVLLPRKNGSPPFMLNVHDQKSFSSSSSPNMNLALNHLPNLRDAYRLENAIVFPVVLFNGALPLIVIHVGESGSKAAAIIDTGSDMLLLGDVERCKTCSTHIFGGARGSDSKRDGHFGHDVVEFGSQKDHVEFRKEDIFIDEYQIRNLSFGLVTHRTSLTEDTSITYNIMGIGGAQQIKESLFNQMHQRLYGKGTPRVFGFMLGNTGNDHIDDEGVFVMGNIPQRLLVANVDPMGSAVYDTTPSKVRVPLHTHPVSAYYTTTVKHVVAYLVDGTNVVYPIYNFPVLFDTGSNYSHFPESMRAHFHNLDHMEFVFEGEVRLTIPNNGLMWNRRPKHPLVDFSKSGSRMITIGTVIMSKYRAIEFHLDPVPFIDFYPR